jgi:hypothetical protein
MAGDRAMMLQHAQELQAEAIGLEAQADALERVVPGNQDDPDESKAEG